MSSAYVLEIIDIWYFKRHEAENVYLYLWSYYITEGKKCQYVKVHKSCMLPL